jgi:hypothetical protein
LRKHRITQDFEDRVTARLVLVAVPVRRPSKKTYFRTHPSDNYVDDFIVLDGIDDLDRNGLPGYR